MPQARNIGGGHFDQIKLDKNKKATATLNDCLACSGCVTSAETVLITQQSVGEFLLQLASESSSSSASNSAGTAGSSELDLAGDAKMTDDERTADSKDSSSSASAVVLSSPSRALSAPRKTIIVTLSPQSRTSLARAFGVSNLVAAQKLTSFFRGLGATQVLDATCSEFDPVRAEFLNRGNRVTASSAGHCVARGT